MICGIVLMPSRYLATTGKARSAHVSCGHLLSSIHTMRSFRDEHGNPWQAALLEASYGNIMLVFTRLGADDIRQTTMDAVHLREAEHMLTAADEARLRTLLSEASPWNR